ncbi:MAG: MlaA family lipoprotein [Alphaproteobacteria bacterium]
MKNKYIFIASIFSAALLSFSPVYSYQAEDVGQTAGHTQDVDDPFEDVNRVIYEINDGVDTILFRPVAELYGVVPEIFRDRVHSAVLNLGTPLTFVNDILQLNIERAAESLGRFIINSTLGIGGLFDVATEVGIPYHSEDFGQTLAAWGFSGGPYIMLPLLGPSNPRDIFGMVGDSFIDPVNIALYTTDNEDWIWYRTGVELLDRRTNAREFTDQLKESLDPYARLRSLYTQSRNFHIRNERNISSGELDSPRPIQE